MCSYEKILKQFDVPSWLIDSLSDMDPDDFIIWLGNNITRLYEISLEFRDLSMQIPICYLHNNIPDPPYSINDDWFPDPFDF